MKTIKRQLTKAEAVQELLGIFDSHLTGLSKEEQNKRLDALNEYVASLELDRRKSRRPAKTRGSRP